LPIENENQKIIAAVTNEINQLKKIKDPAAKSFFMTFFSESGEVAKKNKLLETRVVIQNFKTYFKSLTKVGIDGDATLIDLLFSEEIDVDQSS
jgi:hypothetical protein